MAVILAAGALSAAARAAPGDLDPTFSSDGKQTTGFGVVGVRAGATATVRQPDGKIVAVGWVYSRSWSDYEYFDFAISRYNPNGSLDTTFSDDGLQRTDFGDARANAVALQPDGKIVVVGRGIGAEGYDFALARYNPDGSLDTTFSGDGTQTTAFAGYDTATGVLIRPDGKIVAVGGTGTGNFALARYNPDGSPDTKFSGDGRQTTDFGGFEQANGVALQGDGKIVAVGGTGAGTGDFALARYNRNGSLDPTFSGDGKQTTDFSGDLDEANAVALQGTRIVAAGYAAGDFALARYTPNGSLDPTFSGDGRQTTDFAGHQDAANAVAVRTDDRIVAAGSAVVAGRDFALARYTPNGALSPTFSGDGKQTTDFGGSDSAGGVALLPDGRIVAAGEGGPHLSTFALARYGAGGALDPSFSRDGTLVTSFGSSDRATGVAIQDDGKAVLVGGTGAGGFGLVRYRPDGSLDPTFSGDGRQTSFLYDGIDQANGVALSPNGKIVVVGGGGLGFVVARYNTDGSLDPKFSGDGRQTTYLNGAYGAAGVAIQGDGKIVAVGDAPPSGSGANSFGVVRYKRDGSLDPTFSGDGIQRTAFPSGGAASAVAIQTDGKIVVVGNAGGDFALVRYTPNGSLDPTFSGDGKQTTPAAFHQGAVGVALQDDGKIVVVGNDELVRYKPNGALDQTFSGDGRVDAGFRDNGLAIQPDGGIVIVGQAATGGGDFAVARYKPNGSLDRTFSGDGRQTTDFGGFDEANAVALQANGRIVAVGFGPGLTPTNDFAVARYLGG